MKWCAVYRNNISQDNGQNTFASILIRTRIAVREVTRTFQKNGTSQNVPYRVREQKIVEKGSQTLFRE